MRRLSRRHLASSLLVAPFPGVYTRRAVAYWVLLHMVRAVITMFMAGQPVDPPRSCQGAIR